MKKKSKTQQILEEGLERYERLHRLAEIVQKHPEWVLIEPELKDLKISELTKLAKR